MDSLIRVIMCIRKNIQNKKCKWFFKLTKSSWIHKCHISPHYFNLDINPHKGTDPISYISYHERNHLWWEIAHQWSIPVMILCPQGLQLYISFRNVTSASFFQLSTHKFYFQNWPNKKIIKSYNIRTVLY
jgi:hypothetical protein